MLAVGLGRWMMVRADEFDIAREAAARPCEDVGPRQHPAATTGVRLTLVSSLDEATTVAGDPSDGSLYVGERPGRVWRLTDGEPQLVLDLSDDTATGDDQGLLSLAVSPDGHRLVVNRTDGLGDTRIVEFPMVDGRFDRDAGRELLMIDQPYARHNGGGLAFGPDGLLYVGTGDGGWVGDPQRRAQDPASPLGKLLRLDPDRPGEFEVVARGLRNPYRIAFDSSTGDLWIADVGETCVEEIDFLPAGFNTGYDFGWDRVEGSRRFKGSPARTDTEPLYEYWHGNGWCAIIGGAVYRGAAIPELGGAYVFSDLCKGRLYALWQLDGAVDRIEDLGARIRSVVSLGQDAAGEVYVVAFGTGVYRIDPR